MKIYKENINHYHKDQLNNMNKLLKKSNSLQNDMKTN